MPSSQSQLSLCNISLLAIGNRTQISSLNETSTSANACSMYFPFVFEQLARTARWGCLKKQVTLTLLQAAQGTPENVTGTTLPLPQQPWLYAYLYPADCLFMRAVLCPNTTTAVSGIPQTTVNNTVTPWVSDQQQIFYEIGYSQDTLGNPLQVILTNQENAIGNYTVNQANPSSWDSLFTSAFVASLAAYLVAALSLQPQLMTAQISIAERLIKQAQAIDANESPSTQSRIASWIRARQGATGWGGQLGYNGYGAIQQSMLWPG